MVGNLHNIFMEHDLNIPNDFWYKIKTDNFDPYNCYKYTRVINDGFVVQGHVYWLCLFICRTNFAKYTVRFIL